MDNNYIYYVATDEQGAFTAAYVVGVHADDEDTLQLKYPNATKVTYDEYILYLQGHIRGTDGKPIAPPPPPPTVMAHKKMDEDIAIIYESLIEMRAMLDQQAPTGGNP